MTNHLRFFTGFTFVLIILELITVDRSIEDRNVMNLNANFNKVDGLVQGTEVRLSGVSIGIVNNMLLNKNKPQIEISIRNKINIPTDSSISIQTDGLFGKKYLSIEPGGMDEYLKTGDDLSFTEDSILIQDLLNKIIEIGEIKKGNELWKKIILRL